MKSSLVARLNHVAGRQTLRLTHYGRKSGKAYEVVIWFAVGGEKVFLPTSNVARQWVRNVRKRPRVQLLIGGEHLEGKARFLNGVRERGRAQALIARKYWMFVPVMAIGRLLVALRILDDKSGFFEVTLAPG